MIFLFFNSFFFFFFGLLSEQELTFIELMVFFNLFLNTNLMGLLIANAIQKSEASKDSFFYKGVRFLLQWRNNCLGI